MVRSSSSMRARRSAMTSAAPRDRFATSAVICSGFAIAAAIGDDTYVVCHLAALAGVRPSLLEPLRYLRTNIEGTGVILERMRQLGLKRLVFASSSSVYGARPDHGTAF